MELDSEVGITEEAFGSELGSKLGKELGLDIAIELGLDHFSGSCSSKIQFTSSPFG